MVQAGELVKLKNKVKQMSKRVKYLIGSVSCGTMREEDLIPAFIDTVEYFSKRKASQLRSEWKETPEEWLCEFLNETLFNVLNEYAGPFMYFGSHPGDGADYGFWLTEDFDRQLEDDGGIKVSDLSEVPKGFAGYVAQVSDHGNLTLYSFNRGKATELWAIV